MLNETDNSDTMKQGEKRNINSIFGITFLILAFIMVLYSISNSNNNIGLNSDFLLLVVVVIINLLGYALILLPNFSDMVSGRITNQKLVYWLFVPLILLVSIILMTLMPNLKAQNSIDLFVIGKYFLYIGVPLTIVTFSKLKSLQKIFENVLLDLVFYLFMLFWIWWGIEFTSDLDLFPDLVKGFGYFLNLLAFSTLTWSFFIVKNYEIQRSFSRLFTLSNFKIILTFLLILMIIIVPMGLLTSFLGINFAYLLDKGPLGAIGYLILAIIAVFLVQGIGEEMLFRGFFYFILKNKIGTLSEELRGYVLICLFFIVAGLICLTPYVGLANTITTGLVNSDTIPLKIIYPVIGIVYFVIGVIVMFKTKDLTLTMVFWSSMLFGWAHFEDWRYLIFATIAGFGYCETYRRTNNLFAASVLHMLVDVTWGAVLSI